LIPAGLTITRHQEIGLELAAVPIKLVEVQRLIAQDARKLMRQGAPEGLALKPPDAIHLSTAMRTTCTEFLTCDPRLNKYAGATGLRVAEPASDELALEFGQPPSVER
jgi:predicted nucleic acid-binding protein